MKIKSEGQKGPEVRTSEAMNKKLYKKYFSLTFPLIIDGINDQLLVPNVILAHMIHKPIISIMMSCGVR